MRTVVALSGGLNSVCAAWWYVARTDDEIHLHHIAINSTRRRAEDDAVLETLRYLKTIRPFTYTRTATSLGLRWDIVLVSEEVGRLVRSKKIWRPDRLVRGSRFLEEVEASRSQRRTEALKHWHKYVPGADLTCEPTSSMTRREQVEIMPAELVAASCSCRAPHKRDNRWMACGSCHTCKEFVKEGLRPMPIGMLRATGGGQVIVKHPPKVLRSVAGVAR